MKSLALEISLMFVVALIAVSVVEFQPVAQETPEQIIEDKAQPYETHPDMLLVAFTVQRSGPPLIDHVELVEKGRVSTPLDGDGRLKLIGGDGQVLYSLFFAVDFLLLDGPTERLEKMSYTYVLPYAPQVTKVVLNTPQGELVYDIPEDVRP